ncbi:MAG: N-acetyltransferase [Acidobacteriota bacterium]|nr:N-acetyltransferase [Acidobacteriota bacterium]
MIIIRSETPEDYAAVYRVNTLAFGSESEAALVDKLRAVYPHISLVAVRDNQVVGHIFFSPVSVESEDTNFTALGLAPMAVLPEYQNQGIGSQLVRHGLKECESQGHDVVFVLGHPSYYPRFGFSPAKAKGIGCEYLVPDEVFMVAELKPEALGGRTGLVRYRPEFAEV